MIYCLNKENLVKAGQHALNRVPSNGEVQSGAVVSQCSNIDHLHHGHGGSTVEFWLDQLDTFSYWLLSLFIKSAPKEGLLDGVMK